MTTKQKAVLLHLKYFGCGLLLLLAASAVVYLLYLLNKHWDYFFAALVIFFAIIGIYKMGKSFYKEVIE